MSEQAPSGPGPLIWVVILFAAVAGGIWGVGAALAVGVATTALFILIGIALGKSEARKLRRFQNQYSHPNIENESADCGGDDDDPEIIYYQAIEAYLIDRGLYYDLVLPAQCIDEFMGATLGVYKAGYRSGVSPKVVGALIADAANLYNKNQEKALANLENLERRIGERSKQEEKLAEEILRGEMEPKNAAAELDADKLCHFMIAVQERLRQGPGGNSLQAIDQKFRVTSPEYLQITTELFQTAIDLGKSSTEVSTFLIMAFAAAHEENALEPIARVNVYLRGVIDYLRSSDGSD